MQWARDLVEPNRAAFARIVGTATATLTKYENGQRTPSIFIVREYARRLRVSADFLLFGTLGGGDREIETLLVAHHPELVLSTEGTDMPPPDTVPASGTSPRTMRRRARAAGAEREAAPTAESRKASTISAK